MNAKRTFALQPLSASLKWMTLLPLLLASTQSLARIIDGGPPVAIDGSVASDEYLLRNAAKLTANGATTYNIRAESRLSTAASCRKR
ncbi:hypothetical protein QLG10_01795 [Pseudomonas sp. V98_8]|uniref:hypothetical protein n=1 Tax=Pseudomonas sp. V98_8 TaxID=3044228 RepID=UPI00249F4BE4|nr:hypothetical protein [Pseudomonas sp. V98_8]MDI3391157.1 hypothetical protein [Pseudomonas sp. V98_8]